MIEPILRWPGAKWRIAPWITSLFPRHEVYCEPFFGSGAIFFTKTPSGTETINDIDVQRVVITAYDARSFVLFAKHK